MEGGDLTQPAGHRADRSVKGCGTADGSEILHPGDAQKPGNKNWTNYLPINWLAGFLTSTI